MYRVVRPSLILASLLATAGSVAAAPVVTHQFGAYFREHSLPLCEWGTGERSMWNLIVDPEYGDYGAWTCTAAGKPWDDSCTHGGAPDFKPLDALYTLHPRDQPNNYTAVLQWPDSSALYDVWGVRCRSVPGGADYVDTSTVEGRTVPGSTCSLKSPLRRVVLAEVDGGVVEHVHAAMVRGRVRLGAPGMLPRGANDVTLAIQTYGMTGWADLSTAPVTTTSSIGTYELWGMAAPGVSIRFQVRGSIRCNEHLGLGYDVRDARLQIETCIPDQSNPGACL